MKKVILWGLLCLAVNGMHAQTIIDTWGMTTGVDDAAWIDIDSSYQTLIVGSNTTSARSAVTNIGFPFTLGATQYTTFSTNITGTVRLGSTQITATGYYNQPLGSQQQGNSPKIEPFGCRGRFDNTCYTRMASLGEQGSHVTVIETRIKCYSNQSDSTYMSFQVQLFEAGGLRIVYGPSDEGALRTTMQNGVVAATGTNRDIIFIDFTTHEAARFDGGDSYCTLTNNTWPEEGRWYMLAPNSNACPYPAGVYVYNTNPSDIWLRRDAAPADMRVLIPDAGKDTLWLQTENYMNLGGGFNPQTTYNGTVQCLCDSGRTSYRTRAFQINTGCGPVAHLPWTDNFTGTTTCWDITRFTVDAQQWRVSNNSMICGAQGNTNQYDEWLVSPLINLPDEEGIVMHWKYKATALSGIAPTVDVRIAPCDANGTVDSSDWLTVMTLDTIYNSLITKSLPFDNWRGQRVKVAFVRTGTGGLYTYIDDLELLLEQVPVINLEGPENLLTGDTAVLTCSIVSGVTTGAQWEWHSSLNDEWASDELIWTRVYDTSGFDTVTVIVSNAYGADTATAVIRVGDCSTQIPWVESFDRTATTLYSDCWTISGWNHWSNVNPTQWFRDENGIRNDYREIMISSGRGKYMLTPAIEIPTGTDANNLKLWVEMAGTELMVRLSPTASTDTANYTDTLLVLQTANNTNDAIRWYVADLATYAGQTVRIGLFQMERQAIVNTVKVDYDTLLVLDTIVGVKRIGTGFSADYSIAPRRGSSDGLQYIWTSTLGGYIVNNNILGDSITITYYTGGIDTLSVIATNDYSADTAISIVHVQECLPVTTLPWMETFAEGADCWYKPAGSNWEDHPSQNLTYAYIRVADNNSGDSWIMSPEIDIPADTNECVHLFWHLFHSSSSATHYDVRVTESSDYTNPSRYTTLFIDSSMHQTASINNPDSRKVDLSPYAGMTIHLAFVHHPTDGSGWLYIKDAEVRSAKVPVIDSIDVPLDIYTEDGNFSATAVMAEGTPNGMTFTWRSTLMDSTFTLTVDTLPLNYSQSGTDTLTLIVTNAYGADTAQNLVHVHHCATVGLPFIEPFKSDSSMTCWRSWNFDTANDWGDWRLEGLTGPTDYVMTAGTYYNDANAWLITPEIEIPANADGVNMKVKVYGASSATSLCYLSILASTTGRNDTLSFTDTLHHEDFWSEWVDITKSLNDYAGQHIHLAFVHTGVSYSSYGIHLDSMAIYYEYQPRATVTHTTTLVGDTTFYTASLNNCVTTGLTYTWHSTLADTTATTSDNRLAMVYPAEGTDTVTLIVSNAYLSDTVTTIVEVLDCLIRTLPYLEDFEEINAVTWYREVGHLPHCWSHVWQGDADYAAPHVIADSSYSFIQNIPDNALLLLAGAYFGNLNAYVILPPFAEELQNLSMALDHRKESSTIGTLSVGYTDAFGNYVMVQELNSGSNAYSRDTISFDTVNAPSDAQITIGWIYGNNSYWGAIVDNIEVFFSADTIHLDIYNVSTYSNTIIYPNPASTNVTVRVNDDMPLHVALLDISGRVCKTANGNGTLAVDVRELPAGTYFLRVTTEEGCEVKKLVIR